MNRSAPSDKPLRPVLLAVGELTRIESLRNGSRRAPGRAPSRSNGVAMIFVRRALLVACVIFAGCLVGVLLQRLLPTQHLADAKSAITTIQGLVTLLLALVLGLLIWTSYGVYSQQRSEAQPLRSQIL